ncbi:MAG: GH116 family glycosyl-hydrolase [Capsulimonas sp.]|uniref:GH116 family glycosyl-hydrolase n=1 Tax=Capsulimonas sp. TaxID=2494211 RepID=UPI0032654A18
MNKAVLRVLLLSSLAATHAAAAQSLRPSFEPATGTIVDARWKSGVPLGGIGDGKIELMTDGSFGNFTNQHNWDRPYKWAKGAFAAVRVQAADGAPVARILRLQKGEEYTGLTNVQHTRMQGWFPRAQIDYSDEALPVKVRLEAFSPLIPHDAKNSSLPVAFLDYSVTNTTQKTVKASMLLSWPNLLGWGGRVDTKWDDLGGNSQDPAHAGALQGLRFSTSQSYTDQRRNVLGEDFVGVRSDSGLTVSNCASWDAATATPAFWSGFERTGKLQSAGSNPAQPAGAVAAEATLKPGETRVFRFRVAWAMPQMITVQNRAVVSKETAPSKTDVGAVTDTDGGSRWGTGRAMQAGDNLVVALGRSVTPSSIMIDSGGAGTDYARGLRVEVSPDAKSWKEVAVKTADEMKGASQTIALTPAAGKYLRLTNLGTDTFYWWSVYGMKIQAPGSAEPLMLAPDAVTANLIKTTTVVTEDVGHYWKNWWNSAGEIAAYADKNEDTLLKQTRSWQDPVLQSSLPFWMKLKLINCAFPMFSNTILTKDGRFTVLESPIDMGGALGTMDQRMASHAFFTAFFPELDRAELEMYATCQQTDGRITHFDGNVHEVIGRPDVGYGITDWPDLSSAWVMQAVKLYRWTSDESFLTRMKPHITSAMDWLEKDGADDNLIPAGGSTYDYEQLPRGEFIYSASCYLGALRAASAVSDPAQAAAYDKHLGDVQKSVMADLWNGTYFRKWRQPPTGKTVEDSFVANLAGDWLARLTGLPRTLDPKIIHQSITQTIARHQKPFYPVPPMQVTSQGKPTTTSCYFLQHEPFLGCEAIYENYVDDGIETIKRVYDSAWELNHSPWDQSLAYDAPSGVQSGLGTYMTCPTSWHVLNALAGTSLDLPGKRLYVSPRLATTESELHLPVYFSRFWGWLDYVPAQRHLTLRIDRVFPLDSATEQPLYHVAGNHTQPSDAMTLTSVAADGDAAPIALDAPFVVKEGATLDLSSMIDRLAPQTPSGKVEFEVKAPAPVRPGLPSADWVLSDNLHDSPQLAASFGQIALDGDPASRWTTLRPRLPGDALTLDMGKIQHVAKLVLDSAKSPSDYPRGYLLETSSDGATWTPAARADAGQAGAAQQAGVLTIAFPPTDARYLRITNEGADPGSFWSVHELMVYGE